MSNTEFKSRIKLKNDTFANWEKAVNFIPLKGEMIIYSDLGKAKVGDGVTTVSNLSFLNQQEIGNVPADTNLVDMINAISSDYNSTYTFTLPANNWANKQQTVSIAEMTDKSIGILDMVSDEIYDETVGKANIHVASVSNGSFVVQALGDIPQADINCVFILLNPKANSPKIINNLPQLITGNMIADHAITEGKLSETLKAEIDKIKTSISMDEIDAEMLHLFFQN